MLVHKAAGCNRLSCELGCTAAGTGANLRSRVLFRGRCSLSRSHWTVHTGTHAVAALHGAGSQCASSGQTNCAGNCLVRQLVGESTVATPAATEELLQCAGLPVCPAAFMDSSKAQGSSGESAVHAAVGKWQRWVLHKLMEASLDQEGGWHSATASPSLLQSATRPVNSTCRSWRVFTSCALAL